LNALTGLHVDYAEGRADDYVTDAATDADLVKYGLKAKDGDKLDLLRINVGLLDGKSVTLLVNVGKEAEEKKDDKKDEKKDDKDKEKDKPEPKAPKYYCMREGEKSVFRVAVRAVQPIRKLVEEPDALRDRHLVRVEENKKPDVIRVTRALAD